MDRDRPWHVSGQQTVKAEESSSTDTEEHIHRRADKATMGGNPTWGFNPAATDNPEPPGSQVGRWLELHPEVVTDADFAFYFKDASEALRQAGQAVAAEWSKVAEMVGRTPDYRAAEFLAETREALAYSHRSKEEDSPAITPVGSKRRQPDAPPEEARKFQTKRMRLAPKRQVEKMEKMGEERYAPCLDTLKAAIKLCGSLEAGKSSEADFDAAVGRRAEKGAKKGGTEMLRNVENTWLELTEYASKNEILIPAMTSVDLESYVYSSSGSTRAFNSLKWMVRNLQLSLPIEEVVDPSKRGQGKLGEDSKQAVVIVPPMFSQLEEELMKAIEADDPAWLGLLAQWLAVIGVVRSKHLRRSYPVKLTDSVLHCWCKEGKQKELKNGFPWSCRAHLISHPTYNWARKFLRLWKHVPEEKKDGIGMCFDIEKMLPLTMKAAVDQTRSGMASIIENWDILTYNSFRRAPMTIANKANFSPSEKVALGDWVDKLETDREAIPLRYAGNKKQMSIEIKLEMSLLFEKCLHINDWDEILDKHMQEMRNDPALVSELELLVHKDKAVIWQDQIRCKAAIKFKLWNGIQASKKSIQKEAKVHKSAKETSGHTDRSSEPRKPEGQELATSQGVVLPVSESPQKPVGPAMMHDAREESTTAPVDQPNIEHSVSASTSKEDVPGEEQQLQQHKIHDIVVALEQAKVPSRGEKTRPEVKASDATYNEAQSQWSSLVKDLARKRRSKKGHKDDPEPPTLVVKMQKEGGELWLSGLPTEETFASLFKDQQYDLQICCFADSPTRKVLGKSKGILLPSALQVVINMDAKNMHRIVGKQILDNIYLVIVSLLQGNNALVHCIAGCRRGGIVAAVLRAIAMNQTFEMAREAINQVRFVEIGNALAQYGTEETEVKWFQDLVRQGQDRIKPTVAALSKKPYAHQPLAWGFSGVSERTLVHALIHNPQKDQQPEASQLIPVCMFNQRSQKARFQDATTTEEDQVAIGWGRELCKGCAHLLSARWRVRAGYGPGASRSMLVADPTTMAVYDQYAKG